MFRKEEGDHMPAISSPLPDDARKVTGEALQGALVDLLDLSLVAKQAHWNLVGRNFRSLHLQLDEVVATARQYADVVAERAAAIAVNPDGRARTVATSTGVPGVEPGWLQDTEVVTRFVEILRTISGRMRERIAATADPDPVTQDIFLDVAADLEKHAWMFQAER
jgi:starvation-inducible DNA-binding protein